jgi:uncharacterized protein with NAD-binding domain and iron-sulfur cluster
VADDPEGRYRLRVAFYERYGRGLDGGAGWGDSELAFMRWEIERGVLNPLDDPQRPGSPWWRNVNLEFLYISELAGLVYEARLLREGLPATVRFWLDFIEKPGESTWYRAHNASIIAGYIEHKQDAKKENKAERVFVNIVLYRLLFAQAMVEGEAWAFGPLGEILGNPMLPSVETLVEMPDFYPRHYPLTPEDLKEILGRGHSIEEELVRILDDDIIIPHLRQLYGLAARLSQEPEVERYLSKGRPIYPRLAKRRKVAVLGGGLGAMSAVFAMTDPNNPESELYDITVYQMGWRIGGKGASGRNMEPAAHHRVEEHGLHIWFGFYDNAFRAMRQAYQELIQLQPLSGEPLRAPDAPLSTWQAAFVPHGSAFIIGKYGREWLASYSRMPTNDMTPGDGGLLPISEYIREAFSMFFGVLRARGIPEEPQSGDVDLHLATGAKEYLLLEIGRLETAFFRFLERLISGSRFIGWLINLLGRFFVWILRFFVAREWRRVKDKIADSPPINRKWVTLNFGYAQLRGIFGDRLVERGFNSINHLDYREWLSRHAYEDGGVMRNSAFVQSVYDGSFAYVNGDNTIPKGKKFPPNANMEAGTTLRAALRFLFTYKGAPVWKMQAGMGDTVFTPFYQVLKSRGVKFEFFHRVRDIVPSADGTSIEQVQLGRQATVTRHQRRKGGYDPLFEVHGLPCWPSTPLYDQLVEGEELEAKGINLEEYCADWEDREEVTLTRGKEFDDVICGISLGGLPYVACRLIAMSQQWKDAVTHIKTNRTLGVQVWARRTAWQMGWRFMQQPVLSGYEYREVNPIDTWADMSHLIRRESWDNDEYPLQISYFTGSMLEEKELEDSGCGPMADCEEMDQRKWDNEVKEKARKLLEDHLGPIFPRGDWDDLIDDRPGVHVGAERLDAQYFRANVQPTERYVLTVAGSSRYRLPAHSDEEFTNLYLAGDWIHTHLNYGCVESAVMGGLLAANSLCGYPKRRNIFGLEW